MYFSDRYVSVIFMVTYEMGTLLVWAFYLAKSDFFNETIWVRDFSKKRS